MIEIEDLKDKVAYIEREKIVKIEEDITQIRIGQVETNTLVKEFSKAMDSQCTAMNAMAGIMQEMSLNMRDNNNSIKDLNRKFTSFEETTTREMLDLKCKTETQKMATWTFIKTNIWKIISIIMIVGVVIYVTVGTCGI